MKQQVSTQLHDTPCGTLVLASVGDELCLCDWRGKPCAERNMRRLEQTLNADLREEPSSVICRAKEQIDEYFSGARTVFDLPLRPVGTSFQLMVWQALLEIPFGQTLTYNDMAQRLGNPKGVRAVAQAIGANGIGIIIPCHRVIGSDGSLTGFAGGLDIKRQLLELEGQLPMQRSLFG